MKKKTTYDFHSRNHLESQQQSILLFAKVTVFHQMIYYSYLMIKKN
jgi:hypothetical protein